MCIRIYLCLVLCLAIGSDRVQTISSVLSHPSQVSKDPMPVDDPIGFLKACIRKFDERNVTGYEMVMLKQERIGGQLISESLYPAALKLLDKKNKMTKAEFDEFMAERRPRSDQGPQGPEPQPQA